MESSTAREDSHGVMDHNTLEIIKKVKSTVRANSLILPRNTTMEDGRTVSKMGKGLYSIKKAMS